METGEDEAIEGAPTDTWVDVSAIRHLVKHAITCCAYLILALLVGWLLHHVGQWGKFHPLFVESLKWIDEGYLVLVFMIFAAKTIKFFWKGTLNGANLSVFA